MVHKQPVAAAADLVAVVTVMHSCMQSPENHTLVVVEQVVAGILEQLSVEDTVEVLEWDNLE